MKYLASNTMHGRCGGVIKHTINYASYFCVAIIIIKLL